MIVLCTHCGADLRDGECDCRPREPRRSHFADVLMTAASMGRVDEDTLQRAADALREEPS